MNVSRPLPALLVAASLLGACASTDEPAGRPLSAEEMAYQERLAEAEFDVVQQRDRGIFLTRLNKNIAIWHRSSVEGVGSPDRKLVSNLEEVLQRSVYKNFDLVLDTLLNGDAWQKTVAAAALGFSRLAEPADPAEREMFRDRWPPLYPRAIGPLVDQLSATDPRLVQNALLALWKLGDPATPLTPILDLLNHTDPEVRANAALALSTILTPDTAELAIDTLLNALYDEAPKVRLHAINAIARTRHADAAGRLAQLLDDKYLLIQADAARALGELGDWRNARYLLERLETMELDPAAERRRASRTSAAPRPIDLRRENVRVFVIAALEALSGETYGDDVARWRKWWDAKNAS